MLRSVRSRVVAWSVLIATAVLAVAAVAVVVVVRGQLVDNLDRALEQRADQVEASVLVDPEAAMSNSDAEDRFAQVLRDDGTVAYASANLATAPPLVDPPVRQLVTTRSDLPLEDDAYRVLARRYRTPDGDVVVVVGENIDDLNDHVRGLVLALAVVLPAAVGALAVGVWWLVGRTLRPVEDVRREVAAIGPSALDHRIPERGTGDEVDRLVGTMNQMLERIDLAARSQRRFVADASHELRTPLTRMKARFDVDLADPASDLATTCHDVRQDLDELHVLVDDLLFLARHDAGAVRLDDALVDLDVIVHDEVVRARAESGSPPIDMSSVSAATVRGDAAQLRRVVRNLLDNAQRHAGQRVDVELATVDGAARLVVTDDGPGIAPDDRARVFERFVRLDESRHAAGGGTGLGLAIAHEVVRLHGGSITVEAGPGGGAALVVELPAP